MCGHQKSQGWTLNDTLSWISQTFKIFSPRNFTLCDSEQAYKQHTISTFPNRFMLPATFTNWPVWVNTSDLHATQPFLFAILRHKEKLKWRRGLKLNEWIFEYAIDWGNILFRFDHFYLLIDLCIVDFNKHDKTH